MCMYTSHCFLHIGNVPTVDKGDAHDPGTQLVFSIGFTVGTKLVCLTKSSIHDDVVVNGFDPNEETIGYSALSLTCQQDPSVKLEGAEAILYYKGEVIGINGHVQASSLCPVSPAQYCMYPFQVMNSVFIVKSLIQLANNISANANKYFNQNMNKSLM